MIPAGSIAHPRTYATGVPYEEFARLRAQEPVSWVTEPELTRHASGATMSVRGGGFWAVTSHAAVLEASRSPQVFSSAARGAFLSDPRTRADLRRARQLLVNMDAPNHLRIRRIVTSLFSPRSVAGLSDSVRAHVAALLERLMDMSEFDVVADLAAELPLLVLADLLGLPPQDRALLYRWSNYLVGFDDPEFGGGDILAYRGAMAEAYQYAATVYADRRARPSNDLCSLLANAEIDGNGLSVEEFSQFWLLLVVAGNETTRQLVSGSILALTEDRAQARRLAGREVTLPSAVEELIRWVTPIMQFRRTATEDAEFFGAQIRAQDKVVLYYSSANRDEHVFDRPAELLLHRKDNPHLAFGIGPHFCLGAHLARLELSTLLDGMLPLLHRLQLTTTPVRLESNFVNGIKSMPARLLPQKEH